MKSENRTVQHSYGLLSYFIYIFFKLKFTRDVNAYSVFPLVAILQWSKFFVVVAWAVLSTKSGLPLCTYSETPLVTRFSLPVVVLTTAQALAVVMVIAEAHRFWQKRFKFIQIFLKACTLLEDTFCSINKDTLVYQGVKLTTGGPNSRCEGRV